MKQHHFLPVFLTLIASYLGLHFYAARWLVKSFSLPPSAAAWLCAAFLLAAFFAPFTMYLKHKWHVPVFESIYVAGHAWLGTIIIAAFIFACSDLAALALPGGRGPGQTRLAQAALAALLLILAWAFYDGLRPPAFKEITIALKDLPPALEGYKIVQVSDMHIDSAWKARRFSAMAERINARGPDLVIVTGDFIDPGIACKETLAALTVKLKGRQGVFGSPGNHEYYYGLEKAMDCYRTLGITPLVDEAADLSAVGGPAGLSGGKDLRLIGLGDIHNENLPEAGLKSLLEKFKSGKFTVIMSHQPVYYGLMADTGNYLVFSGHTHKGQIFPFHVFTRIFYRYFYGLYRIKDSVFYVTSGAGTWGPSLRWLAPAEIPVITLKKE